MASGFGDMVVLNKGDKILDKKLSDLQPLILSRVIRRATGAAMTPVVQSARKNLKKNKTFDTGALSRSIGKKTKVYKRSGVVVTLVGPRRGFKDAKSGRNPTNYAHLIELGFRVVKRSRSSAGSFLREAKGFRKTSETLTKVPAKPFLRPALDDNENAVLSRYRRELARGIERVGKKMGRRSR